MDIVFVKKRGTIHAVCSFKYKKGSTRYERSHKYDVSVGMRDYIKESADKPDNIIK